MSDSKDKPTPKVQVIRRPAPAVTPTPSAAPAPAAQVKPVTVVPVRPAAPAPRGSAPRPTAAPTPSASAPAGTAIAAAAAAPPGPRPVGSSSPRPGGRPPPSGGRPGFKGPPRFSGPPRPPPTAEQVQALARKERVPARIAKGDLEGKMKCRIWKKLHAEEAKRFDQAWQLMETTPGLELADAFGAVQSGLPLAEFMQRRSKAKKKEAVREARSSVSPVAIDAFVAKQVAEKAELTFVLGERVVTDVITEVQPVAFVLERSGRLDKVNVVLLAKKSVWEPMASTVDRDPKLSQKPLPVSRQPSRRPVSDPRPLLDHLGKPVKLNMRNGINLKLKLLAVGPFDLLLGNEGEELFVPLHAIAGWSPAS